ncbi:MAG: hypothetical protein BAJATHORv1_10237 [Candidatus Thorarchaeota archaeon]|nr:MAG: hypothetical protein BAJATHORv1_10237 [Candidatus Thorarchaeota archaeon]
MFGRTPREWDEDRILTVYVESVDESKIAKKQLKVADVMTDMMFITKMTEKGYSAEKIQAHIEERKSRPSPFDGDTGLHFELTDQSVMLTVHSLRLTGKIPEYRIIDKSTGKLLTFENQPIQLVVVGSHDVIKKERKLKTPCIRVGKHVWRDDFLGIFRDEDIMKFYHEKRHL